RLIEFLHDEKRQGRALFLVTASDRSLAQKVANHLGVFDEVLASDGTTNLRGKTKGALLQARFGQTGFDYAGNSSVDLPVWAEARHAIVVNAGAQLTQRARKCSDVVRVFELPDYGRQPLIRALRPHQWVKNLIIFVPLLTSHKLNN